MREGCANSRCSASTASFYQCDITSTANLKEVAAAIRQKHGHPTILINNAGFGRGGTILDESESDIRRTFEVNTISHFWTVKEFVPDMIQKNHGHIITIASLASFIAPGEIVDYSCTKAAALAFHEGLTQELKHWHKVGKVRTRYACNTTIGVSLPLLTLTQHHSSALGAHADDLHPHRRRRPFQAAPLDPRDGLFRRCQAGRHPDQWTSYSSAVTCSPRLPPCVADVDAGICPRGGLEGFCQAP